MNEAWRERLTRVRHMPILVRFMEQVRALSPGDRVIFYTLVVLFGIASLSGILALERSLLVEVPAYGGTLVEGEVGSPQFINPLLAVSDADRDLSALVYAGLMGISGSGELVQVLAESYTVGDGGKEYTFTLREDAMFSDGTPVTADDVVFTVEKAQNAALKSPKYADWAGVNASASDSRTVRFALAKPYAPFPWLTTLGILPSRVWRNVSNEAFPFSTLETSPIGAGPFMVRSVARDASGLIKSVSLDANPRYALGRPYLDSIHFIFYSRGEDLADALADGEVESAYGIAASAALKAPYARVFGVFWNQSEKQVYARAEVRKALSTALDRSAIISSALGGYATAIMGPVPPGVGIKQALVLQSENPTATAATILQSGGWAYDSSARAWSLKAPAKGGSASGAKQTLDRITLRTSNVPELKNVASAVKADWEKLGIAVDIELYEPGDLSQNVIRPRKYEALLYGMVIGRDQDLYAFWHSHERNDPGLNIALYANKTVDALLENVRGTIEWATHTKSLQKIENIVAADYPAAFLYAPDFIYAVPHDLRGVMLPQVITPADRFATAASWYRATEAVWPFFAR